MTINALMGCRAGVDASGARARCEPRLCLCSTAVTMLLGRGVDLKWWSRRCEGVDGGDGDDGSLHLGWDCGQGPRTWRLHFCAGFTFPPSVCALVLDLVGATPTKRMS